jgi:D-3-phosphoglycerate dehydrogenase
VARVVVTDYTFPCLDIEESVLKAAGHDLSGHQARTVEALLPIVAEADAVITQFAPLTAEVIAAMKNARVIARYGIGVDNIDLEAAARAGIPVCNVPEYCIDEVADHTLAFILAVTRQVVSSTLHIREGKWGLSTPMDAFRTLRDQSVGIIGFGRIGREVAVRLKAFKARCLVFDPVVPADSIRAAGCEPVSLEDLFSSSDIVTLHCPSSARTRKIVSAEAIARMKPGGIIVNLARGDLIDTPALIAALESGHIAAAALDVFDPEPVPADSPLRKMPQVISASHLASVSPKAVATLRETTARTAAIALRGEKLAHIVNGVVQS